MTVTPKQLREAADTLDALYTETGRTSYCAGVTRGLREMADERDIPVGTVRQSPRKLNTYTKVGENSWVGAYPSGVVRTAVTELPDAVVDYAPIIHKPS